MVVFNTDVAASENITDHWLGNYPSSDKRGYAFGTNANLLAYDANHYTDIFEDLWDNALASGNYDAVFMAAGCPKYIEVTKQDGLSNDGRLPLQNMLAATPYIVNTIGEMPRARDGGSGNWSWCNGATVINGSMSDFNAGFSTSERDRYNEVIDDIHSNPSYYKDFTGPSVGRARNYSGQDIRLSGYIGMPLRQGVTTFPASLETDSEALIDRAAAGRKQSATNLPVVCSTDETNDGSAPGLANALSVLGIAYDVFVQAGYSDVNSFDGAAGNPITNDPMSDVLEFITSVDITEAACDAGTVDQSIWIALGSGFQNNQWSTDASDNEWMDPDNPQFTFRSDSICAVGNSDSYEWLVTCAETGVGGVGSHNHESGATSNSALQRAEALVAGFTLAEIAYAGNTRPDYVSCFGDPFYQPIDP